MTTLPESKMSTTRYTMWYWYDQSCSFKTEDPNFSLNQLSKLVNAVQKEVNDETLVRPSQDPARPRQMEVAVFFPTSDADQGRFSRETGTELINRKARELKLPCSDFVSQSVENVRSFTRQEIERVFSFAKLPPNLIKEASEKIPPGQSHSGIYMTRRDLNRLTWLTGKCLAKEMEAKLRGPPLMPKQKLAG